jgi:hypothetical protein
LNVENFRLKDASSHGLAHTDSALSSRPGPAGGHRLGVQANHRTKRTRL